MFVLHCQLYGGYSGYGIRIYLHICRSKDMPYILLQHFAVQLYNQCAVIYCLQSHFAFSTLHYLLLSNHIPSGGLTQQLRYPHNYDPNKTLTVTFHNLTLLVSTNDRNNWHVLLTAQGLTVCCSFNTDTRHGQASCSDKMPLFPGNS